MESPMNQRSKRKRGKDLEKRPKKIKTSQKPENPVSIKFARGFHIPKWTETKLASGLGRYDVVGDKCGLHAKKHLRKLLDSDLYQSVPSPTSTADWLAQYKEEGQSFALFEEECPWLSTRKIKYYKDKFYPKSKNLKSKYPTGKIYLKPIGELDNDAFPNTNGLAEYTRKFLSLDVVVLEKVDVSLPKEDADMVTFTSDLVGDKGSRKRQTRINFRQKNGHLQLKVQSIHTYLQSIMPNDALCLVAVTTIDLYEESPDLFVAGMANGNKRVAVFSFARYDPALTFSEEFWYSLKRTKKVKKEIRSKLLFQRSCKLLVHEILHLLGIDHCIWFDCCMNGSGHLEEDFRQSMFLCPVDLHKLHRLTEFDVLTRYKELKIFLEKHGLDEESEWLRKAIDYLDSKSVER